MQQGRVAGGTDRWHELCSARGFREEAGIMAWEWQWGTRRTPPRLQVQGSKGGGRETVTTGEAYGEMVFSSRFQLHKKGKRCSEQRLKIWFINSINKPVCWEAIDSFGISRTF